MMSFTKKQLTFHLLSDLHLEFNPDLALDKDIEADVIVLAGDIAIGTDGLHWAKKNFPKHEIIYVAGNHEFYHHDYHTLLCDLKGLSDQLGIHFLENKEITISGVRILGCTLWTDYLASPGLSQLDTIKLLQKRFADHRFIQYQEKTFTPENALDLHQQSIIWLEKKLTDKIDIPTVVISHHGPSLSCYHKKFGHSELAGGFYSDLDKLLNKADIWMYGHTHSNLDKNINGTRLISNQYGYPHEQVPDFNNKLTITV